MKIRELETPALWVDKPAMERNMDLLAKIISKTSMKLYPHYKSHKCPAIAKLQLAKGAAGITCANLGEAIDLGEAGIANIVIANEVVQAEKLPKVAALAQKCRLTLCVDNADNILALEQAMAQQGGGTLNLLVEYDVGMNRNGVETHEDFVTLAKLIEAQPHLHFEGIQGYAGHMSHEEDPKKRFDEVQRIEADIVKLKAYCEENGLTVTEICGGSTGFSDDKPSNTVYTQGQFGSYLFMDQSFRPLNLDFEQALFVETTVLTVKQDFFVVDCGTKTMTMDSYPPSFAEFPGAKLTMFEEHTTVWVRDSGLKPGDKLRYIPGHCCTTINIFDKMYAVDGDDVVDTWEITSRGKAW